MLSAWRCLRWRFWQAAGGVHWSWRAGKAVCQGLLSARPQIDKNVERELQNHRQLSGHPNIIRFREVGLRCAGLSRSAAVQGGSGAGKGTAPQQGA